MKSPEVPKAIAPAKIENKEQLAKFRAFVETRPSDEHKEHNEDRAYKNEAHGVFAVFDGIGGSAGGERAARVALNQLDSLTHELADLDHEQTVEEANAWIGRFMSSANTAILEDQVRGKLKSTGTTASVVRMIPGEKSFTACVGNIGDSRVYVKRKSGELIQITLDHSDVGIADTPETRVLQTKLSNVRDPKRELTMEEWQLFRDRNVITEALGSDRIDIRSYTIADLEPGDKILITSDGIHDNLTHDEIDVIMDDSAELASTGLLASAHRRSLEPFDPRAKPDDMTLVVFEVPELKKPKDPKTFS